MRPQQDLQVALRERLRRLMMTNHLNYGREIALTCSWIERQPPLRAIIADLTAAEPETTVAEWLQECQLYGLKWTTSTEAGRARLVWDWMKGMSPDDMGGRIAFILSNHSNANDAMRDVSANVVDVLFSYLSERLTAESSVLYLLERWVRRVEWFERDALYADYQTNTRQGEAVYDRDLRRWLFDQGMNMPLSQARSASGLSDVLSDLDGDDPLACEVKLFDGQSHGRREVAVGLQQAVSYAHDYGLSAAYLMVINLSGRALELPSDTAEKVAPPYVVVSGVRVHLLSVRARPVPSASKAGPLKPVAWVREDLINPDA